LKIFVPRVDIAHGVCSILRRRVLVSQDLSPQRCFAGLVLVRLTISDEELLAARETILLRRRFAIQRSDVSVVGGSNPAKVGNVLAQSLFAVKRKVRKWMIVVVLFN